MRIRTIKPEFWTDEKIVELSAWARLLFIGLWQIADDEGRLAYSSRRIQLMLFPANPEVNVGDLIQELAKQGLVEGYNVDGDFYCEIRNFGKHQKIDARYPSRLPPNPATSRRLPPKSASGREGNGNGMEGRGEKTPAHELRDRFKKFLARRLLASKDEMAVEEFIGLAGANGAKGFDQLKDFIDACLECATRDGVTPRYARDLARYGPRWRPPNPEAAKESA